MVVQHSTQPCFLREIGLQRESFEECHVHSTWSCCFLLERVDVEEGDLEGVDDQDIALVKMNGMNIRDICMFRLSQEIVILLGSVRII